MACDSPMLIIVCDGMLTGWACIVSCFFSRKQAKSDEFAGKVGRGWSKNHKQKV